MVSCLWDKDRDGFVMGEGVGVVMLEEYDVVVVCGVIIYVELVGFGMSGDVYYMMFLFVDGEGVVVLMENVIRDVGIMFESIGYINVYGMFILVGDVVEVVVVKCVFNDYVYELLVSLIKLMIGYLLGVVGFVEVIFMLLVFRDKMVLFIINLDILGEGCDLDFVVKKVKVFMLEYVLCNLFGFGGINGLFIFKWL